MTGTGAVGYHPVHPISEWRKAIPRGTRVMLFFVDLDPAQGKKLEHAGRGHPEGSEVMITPPQGMIFEYEGNLVSYDEDENPETESEFWGMTSIDEISATVKEYLDSHERVPTQPAFKR